MHQHLLKISPEQLQQLVSFIDQNQRAEAIDYIAEETSLNQIQALRVIEVIQNERETIFDEHTVAYENQPEEIFDENISPLENQAETVVDITLSSKEEYSENTLTTQDETSNSDLNIEPSQEHLTTQAQTTESIQAPIFEHNATSDTQTIEPELPLFASETVATALKDSDTHEQQHYVADVVDHIQSDNHKNLMIIGAVFVVVLAILIWAMS
ncbi:hypothetical protein A3K93_09615 [Acinetobacter sp. NCu2D-2]|uniref:hypothetical protein n=1 Tax=Acinetobacter sp. NCu2D-2 TaxID=1608473 RepID=UPI0007CDAF7D|nr:hypothetical protein [Acinetobacter sp. NCu2D-2]ANF82429.1 hypothetical protein A3K93_09615 [Acinetobacter sp. NCu2D-2]